MISIVINRDGKGSIAGFTVEGHAEYIRFPALFETIVKSLFIRKGSYAGFDTICAAVSAVTQSAVLGLKEVLDVPVGIEIEDGFLECILPEHLDRDVREKADIILETMVLSLKDLAGQYKEHIEIVEAEV